MDKKKTAFIGGTGYARDGKDPHGTVSQKNYKNGISWCPQPWTSYGINNNGDYRMCIQANTHRKSRGILRDEDGVAMRADKQTVADTRNCPMLKDVPRQC